jgi:glycosyltransferase involved in cell wall biosynthesis
MLSIVIPSRNEKYLQRTIDDLLEKAEGDIEIIAILDGYWPDPQLPDNPRVILLHRGESRGMRNGITSAVAIAKGEYIMKCDAHCMFDKGFDVKLIADCEKDWVVIPRRKRLDAVNWLIKDVGKIDIDYEYLSYPSNPNDFGGPGLNGKIWNERAAERKDILIDENMSFQGSCWFMHKAYFYELELMDEESYGPFWNEAQEIGLKCWLSGGKVMVNKKTWYAHLHKGKEEGRGYFLSKDSLNQGAAHTRKWMMFGEAWHGQRFPIEWLIERFAPVPTWDLSKNPVIDDTLSIIRKKYGLPNQPIVDIPNVGRNDLAALFAELGFKKGAEIGVESGLYSEVLCKANPDLHLYLVDAWKAYRAYRDHVTQEKIDGFHQATLDRMKDFNVTLIRKFSLDALSDIPDGSLDFVYIDANHRYEFVKQDIEGWAKKVRPGGIVSGHDFIRRKHPREINGVVDAVLEYTKDIPLLILGRKEVIPGEVRDSTRSWMFIKQ